MSNEHEIKIKAIEMRIIDDLFGMGDGYVLGFSNKTFAEFFEDELDIDIDSPRYEAEGTSKAKRLRYFLRNEGNDTRIRTLLALWEYREATRRRNNIEENFPNAREEFNALIERLGGTIPGPTKKKTIEPIISVFDSSLADELKTRLLDLSKLEPQQRGYAFEIFLKELFEANKLAPRAPFRLVGEQIDGSFELISDTYLLEAKWTNSQIGVGDLHSFHGKLDQKAAWSRGLFISQSGFTEVGLTAFGKGKRVICMDGLDLYEMLDKNLPFGEVISKKARRAAESGNPFVRVRELYL